MICLLFRNVLLLATASKAEQTYNVQASIGLSDAKVEEADNGRGKTVRPYLCVSFG